MPNLLTPVAIWVGRRDAARENSHLVVSLDQRLSKATRGRMPLLRIAGLPTLTLHVPGRKSRVERSTPLLCASWRNGFVIVGSNWGDAKAPVWVHNLRAADEGEVAMSVHGVRLKVDVREITDADRSSAWRAAARTWPNYEIYASRTTRQLPIFHLTPRL